MKLLTLFLIPGFLLFTRLLTAGDPPSPSDEIVLRGDKKLNIENRTFAFTNKAYGQYYSETADYFTDGWMGWTLREQRIFNDYAVIPKGGAPLPRSEAEVFVYPYKTVRNYPGGVTEKFVFADNKDVIVIQLTKVSSFRFVLKGIGSTAINKFAPSGIKISTGVIRSGYHLFVMSNALIAGAQQSGDSLIFEINSKADTTNLILCALPSEREAMTEFKTLPFVERVKKERIDKLLNANRVRTNNSRFDKAFLWAVANADALVAQQDMKGIFAGLPWFNNFWGRDTFISLAGCTYTIGNYADARKIILAFLNALDINPKSEYYGRVPNRITLNERIYNTTDGTPRLISEAEKYFRLTGDTALVKIIYPKVVTAFAAATEKWIDENGFLTHADAETWMDAVGPDGPWSPRGNRANDIQALWYLQLNSTAYFAGIMGDTDTKNKSLALAEKVKTSFRKHFLNPATYSIYDRLTKSGEKDNSYRPNFYIPALEKRFFTNEAERIQYSKAGIERTTTEKGVYSLNPGNKNFHPFHQYPPYYPKDAAYHNGIIWQWNTGPAVSLLTSLGRSDLAWEMTTTLTDEILDRGMLGGMAELMDAFTRQGEQRPRLSGTYLQAWSVAEYIRNVYEDYAGSSYNAESNVITLKPVLPAELSELTFSRNFLGKKFTVKYKKQSDLFTVSVTPEYEKGSFTLQVTVPGNDGSTRTVVTEMREDVPFELMFSLNGNTEVLRKTAAGNKQLAVTMFSQDEADAKLIRSISFNKEVFSPDIPALKGPSYPLLKNSEAVRVNPSAKAVVFPAEKRETNGYEYPTNPVFKPGIAEMKSFQLFEDEENYYFTLTYSALTNPGWHNEYGYQLTYTSICINTGNGPVTTEVRRNSKYTLPEERAYSLQINVGGGFEIRNAAGEVTVAYLPVAEDVKNPLGNTQTGTVHFAVPKKYTGIIPANAAITILTGLQDDHGGAGIGEFREVQIKTEEWAGGGKKDSGASNVYSVIKIN